MTMGREGVGLLHAAALVVVISSAFLFYFNDGMTW